MQSRYRNSAIDEHECMYRRFGYNSNHGRLLNLDHYPGLRRFGEEVMCQDRLGQWKEVHIGYSSCRIRLPLGLQSNIVLG